MFNSIERIKKGEPVDYVIGFVEFLGCKIDLSLRPLIPRPETEYWVREAITLMQGSLPCKSARGRPSQKSKIQCLDLFAGSGCIGLALLKHIPWAVVDFAEKEKKFLKQIGINAKLNHIPATRYRLLQSDVFSNAKGGYDYIFANPPYIAETRRNKVQSSVLRWEDPKALFAGKDGLHYIRIFLQEAKSHLKKDGKIYMEFDSFQKLLIHKLLKKYGYREWKFCKDQYDKWRYVIVYEM